MYLAVNYTKFISFLIESVTLILNKLIIKMNKNLVSIRILVEIVIIRLMRNKRVLSYYYLSIVYIPYVNRIFSTQCLRVLNIRL